MQPIDALLLILPVAVVGGIGIRAAANTEEWYATRQSATTTALCGLGLFFALTPSLVAAPITLDPQMTLAQAVLPVGVLLMLPLAGAIATACGLAAQRMLPRRPAAATPSGTFRLIAPVAGAALCLAAIGLGAANPPAFRPPTGSRLALWTPTADLSFATISSLGLLTLGIAIRHLPHRLATLADVRRALVATTLVAAPCALQATLLTTQLAPDRTSLLRASLGQVGITVLGGMLALALVARRFELLDATES